MQREPGRGREGGEGRIDLSDAMGVHVTERDVTVLLTNDDQGRICFPQECGSDHRRWAVYALMRSKKRGYRAMWPRLRQSLGT